MNYIMNFDKDYQNVKTVILDQNYRSTKTILDISNNLIKKNKNRLEKDLFSELEEGDKVIHYAAVSEDAESKYICDTIQKITQSGVSESHIAVLYRAKYLSRSIEQEMIRRQIPYKIFGGLKFFNRKEVKDALSYISGIEYVNGIEGICYYVDTVVGENASYWRFNNQLITDGDFEPQNFAVWISLDKPYKILIYNLETGEYTEDYSIIRNN